MHCNVSEICLVLTSPIFSLFLYDQWTSAVSLTRVNPVVQVPGTQLLVIDFD